MTSIIRIIKRLIPSRSPIRLGWHYAKAFVAALINGFPARKLTVIGVTGTDGKTTVVSMISHILQNAGRKVGSASTTSFRIGDKVEANVTQKTSMSPFLLQKKLREMVKAGCEFGVLEISSHGLVQGRVHHVFPQVAAVTNTSEEHLDYHGTMEKYRKDKGKLFRMLKGKGTKVLNAADESYRVYRNIPSGDTVTFNDPDGGYWTSEENAKCEMRNAKLHTDLGGIVDLGLSIPGAFNFDNAMCAIGCCVSVGIPLDVCVNALSNFRGVEGRLEEIDEGQNFRVFVDFTVTVAAYEGILSSLRSMMGSDGRLLVLTGACGNRMQEKRPSLGKVCSERADVVVVTSDETYGEPHEKIIEEIWSGIDQSACEAHKVKDRREAIEFIIAQARDGDVVAICGMAGVTTMMTPEGQIEWDEGEIVREVLRSRS